jgi:hypothetical protein
MNIKTALLGFALLTPASLYATDADAFAKCDAMEDAKKAAKCEKKAAKTLGKLRAKTTPMAPSALNSGLSSLDGDDANPFNMDDYYTPAYEPLKIDAVDQVLGGVSRINGALTMANYVGQLSKDGKTAEAKKLASALLPELVKMKKDIDGIKEGIDKIKADPAALAKDNPMAVPKIVGGAATALGQIPGMIADLPKAVAAIKPLAAGAAGAAVNAAADKAGDAMGGAAGAAGDAAGKAKDAADKAKDAASGE